MTGDTQERVAVSGQHQARSRMRSAPHFEYRVRSHHISNAARAEYEYEDTRVRKQPWLLEGAAPAFKPPSSKILLRMLSLASKRGIVRQRELLQPYSTARTHHLLYSSHSPLTLQLALTTYSTARTLPLTLQLSTRELSMCRYGAALLRAMQGSFAGDLCRRLCSFATAGSPQILYPTGPSLHPSKPSI